MTAVYNQFQEHKIQQNFFGQWLFQFVLKNIDMVSGQNCSTGAKAIF